jgi:hypothetical protein
VAYQPRAVTRAFDAEEKHDEPMSKPRVTFKYERIAEDNWQIAATASERKFGIPRVPLVVAGPVERF